MTSSYNVLQNLDLGLSLNNIYNEQFAIVPDSSPSLFTSTKRVRADSGCYLSDLEFLDSSEDESLLTPPDTKRRCSGVNSAQDCDLFEHYLQNLPCNTRITDTGSFCPLDLFSNTEQRSFSNPQQQEPLQFEDCSIAIESMQQPTYNVSSPPTIGTTVSGLNFDQSSQFKLVISEQPEQYYRARYGSEGVRAPLKGIRDSYPTVQVIGLQNNHGTVVAKLVHEDGSDHTCCSLDSSEDRKNALTKKIGPFNNMSAEFEDLRIKREKKKEGRKNITAPDKSQGKDIRNDKVACILFTATVETSEGNVECSVISHPICLTAAPEPAELDWLEPCRGHFGGKEGIVIKGSKMTSPKVVFRISGSGSEMLELQGVVDKEKSHQNVLVVRTPVVDSLSLEMCHKPLRAEVVVITGRNQMSSNSLGFEFIPDNVCRECMQKTPIVDSGYSFPPANEVSSQPPQYNDVHVQGEAVAFWQGSLESAQVQPQSSQSPFSPQIPVFPKPTLPEHLSKPVPNCPSSTSKPNDEIIRIVQELFDPESNASDYNNGLSHIAQSPISPVYHPDGSSTLPPQIFNNIELQLEELLHNHCISQSDFLVYKRMCRNHQMDILQAYQASQGDQTVFTQLLASIKPQPVPFSTHQ